LNSAEADARGVDVSKLALDNTVHEHVRATFSILPFGLSLENPIFSISFSFEIILFIIDN
jgi:hypothetical protein